LQLLFLRGLTLIFYFECRQMYHLCNKTGKTVNCYCAVNSSEVNCSVRKIIPVLVIAFFIASSCRKEDGPRTAFVPGETISYIVVAGDTVTMNSNMPGFFSLASVNKVIGFPDSSSAIYASQLYHSTLLHPAIIIKKGELAFSDTVATDAQFIDFFKTGIQNWSVNALNGVEVIYVDPQGNIWNTSEMGGYQGTHRFEITEAIPFIDNGTRCVKIKAVFDCTFYHPAYQPFELIQGVYIGIFINI
jgi:hypothetical protein